MKAVLKTHVARLNVDYTGVSGSPFYHFFCPILYRDEDTKLCRAHVINAAFRDSDRSCTVQRADVDAFYGSLFEAEFLAIQEKDRNWGVKFCRTKPSLDSSGHGLSWMVRM